MIAMTVSLTAARAVPAKNGLPLDATRTIRPDKAGQARGESIGYDGGQEPKRGTKLLA
jgi:hypothetical protein